MILLHKYNECKYVIAVVVEHNGSIYVFGGLSGDSFVDSNDLYAFDPGKILLAGIKLMYWTKLLLNLSHIKDVGVPVILCRHCDMVGTQAA